MTGLSAGPLLAIRSLRAAYGKIEALKGVDLDLYSGEVLGLVERAEHAVAVDVQLAAVRRDARAEGLLVERLEVVGDGAHGVCDGGRPENSSPGPSVAPVSPDAEPIAAEWDVGVLRMDLGRWRWISADLGAI